MASVSSKSLTEQLAWRTRRDLRLRALTGGMPPSVRRERIKQVESVLSHAPPAAGMRTGQFPAVADAAIHLVCGTALVVTLLLPWTRRGNASLVSGNQLAGFLLKNGHGAAAIAIYGLGACGCLVMAAAASQHLVVRAAIAVVAASITAGLLVVAVGPVPIDRWGAAPALGAGGAATVLVVELRCLLRRFLETHAVVS
jgi:hypothetical protein